MKQIIVSNSCHETRIAVMENGKLVELFLERPVEKRVEGHIYKGKVMNILPGMQAAFIDIGLEKNAFLYVDDALPSHKLQLGGANPSIREILKEGQEIIVQVIKEPTGTKGARVTTRISLPGRFLVYMPNDQYYGISRRIESGEERDRLRQIAHSLCKDEEGVIIRTAAEGATDLELQKDVEFLREKWKLVLQLGRNRKPPLLLYHDLDLISRIARDLVTEDVDEFLIDDIEEYKKVLSQLGDLAPGLKEKIKHYSHRTSLIDLAHLEAEIEKALKRKVWLKSGGYLVIDQTEALTVIDVNTGKYTGSQNLEATVFKTNLEAAKEIARQLRLRDIGGIIIIDFIDMRGAVHREEIIHLLTQEIKKDRTKSHILGFTQLGLLEMTRKKARQNIHEILMRPCPACEGRGKILTGETISGRIEREIIEFATQSDVEAIVVEAHPEIADILAGRGHMNIDRMHKEWGVQVFLKKSEAMDLESYSLVFVGSREEAERRAARS
jgi:ribonuclease G